VTDLATLAAIIDEAFERRADITARNAAPALRHAGAHATGFDRGLE